MSASCQTQESNVDKEIRGEYNAQTKREGERIQAQVRSELKHQIHGIEPPRNRKE